MIILTYYIHGKYYDHLSFKSIKLAKKWYKILIKRGATNIKWIEE